MARRKITKSAVDQAKTEARVTGKAVFIWDAELSGFGVRAAPPSTAKQAGSATYYLQFWIGGRGGKAERVKIGKHGDWTADTARKEAQRLRLKFQSGENPADDKRKQRKAVRGNVAIARHGERFAEAWAAYSKAVLHNSEKPLRTAAEQDRLIEKNVIPTLGERPFKHVTNDELRGVLKEIEERSPNVARTTRGALKGLFKWACDPNRGNRLSADPMAGIGKPEGADGVRRRRLKHNEIASFWYACDVIGWPFGLAFKLLLLTAARRDEVCSMRWREIDIERGEWTIPASRAKNGLEHIVSLPRQALAILASLPRMAGQDLVFSTTGTTPISGFSKIKLRLDALMQAELGYELTGEDAFVLHDLRRAARTQLARLGVDEDVAERMLNHVKGGIVGIYNVYDYWPQRVAAAKLLADEIDRIIAPAPARRLAAAG